MAETTTGKLAIVTGASTGIGFELARLCAADGMTVIVCADEPQIEAAAERIGNEGGIVEAVQADLSTEAGVATLWSATEGRPVDYLLANAGVGLGGAFLDQEVAGFSRVIDTNITGTTLLLHKVGRDMLKRNSGRILITGSIAGFIPGSFQAIYNASKAYLDSLSYALRNELKETDVTVTCLMPGPTDTDFFDRAGMNDTPVGENDNKADPAKVASDGYHAMMKGESGVVSGFMNRVQATFAGIIPDTVLAQMHRKMAEPEQAH